MLGETNKCISIFFPFLLSHSNSNKLELFNKLLRFFEIQKNRFNLKRKYIKIMHETLNEELEQMIFLYYSFLSNCFIPFKPKFTQGKCQWLIENRIFITINIYQALISQRVGRPTLCLQNQRIQVKMQTP